MNTSTTITNKHHVCLSDFYRSDNSNENPGQLRIMQINARSCASLNKFDEIKTIINSSTGVIDIIVISETWFKRDLLCLYDLSGYACVHSCRHMRIGGGLSIYIKEPCTISGADIYDDKWFSVHIELRNYKGMAKLNVCGIYRPPCASTVNDYITKIEETMGALSGEKIIVGDVNIDINRGSDRNARKYQDTMSSIGMTLCNNIATRESSNAIIDHVYLTQRMGRKIHTDTIRCDFSDHNILITTIKAEANESDVNETVTKIDYNRIVDIVSDHVNVLPHTGCPNEQYESLCDLLLAAIDQATSTKRKKPVKRKYCEWITRNPAVMNLIRQKNNLWRKHKNKIRNNTCAPNVLARLRDLSCKLSDVKTQSKSQYYADVFAECDDIKSTWKAINNVVSTGKIRDKSKKIIIAKNNTEVTDQCVADEFANYYATVARNIADKIEVRAGDGPNKLGTLRYNNSSIFLRPVTPEEVLNLITSLKTKKSAGIDGISVKTIKSCAHLITPTIADLINNCFSSGVYPQALKKARVVPVYKAGDKTDVSNYRPISVLPVINTVIERALLNRLLDFFESEKFLYTHQYGFRKRSGTRLALTEIIDMIQLRIDNKDTVTGLFMDLSKAFDCVDHAILLYKLEMAGVRGLALKLLESYLSNRKMVVNVNGTHSAEKNIGVGVPQGSVIGSLMYLVYVNDMAQLKLHGKLRLFADDSAVFYATRSVSLNINHMHEDIRILSEYFRINKLTLNAKKTNFVHFTSPSNKINAVSTTNVDGTEYQRAETVKYLGLYLDSHLNWNSHVDHISTKIAAATAILRKLSFLPTQILRKLYFALAHSHLSYAAIVWAAAKDNTLNRVQVLQRKALKACYKLNIRFSTIDLFTNAAQNIQPLKAIRVQQTCELVYSAIHNMSPTNMVFEYNQNRHSARRATKLTVPPFNTHYGKSSVSHFGPTCFNELDEIVRSSLTESIFKYRLRKFLASQMTKYIK